MKRIFSAVLAFTLFAFLLMSKVNAYTTNYKPIGNVEAITASADSITVAGWAYDPDDASQSISVKVYIGSTFLGTVDTNFERSDVNNKFSISGNHGYGGSVSTTYSGTQTVTVKAVDLESGVEYTIGSKSVTIPSSYTTKSNPKGNVEAITEADGSIKVRGWAYDPDDASKSINVKAYIGTTCIGTLSANQTRSDVNNAFSITGNHGFNGILNTNLTGTQTVTIKAVDLGSGAEYTIGSKSVIISSPYANDYDPIGNVEAVTATTGSITIAGWAYDPDYASQSISIKAYIDSTCIGTLNADLARADVNSAYSISGNHGFGGDISTTFTGIQNVTIKAVDVNTGSEYTIGNKIINIPTPITTKYNPTGYLDAVTASVGKISLSGWAYDPDGSYVSVDVKVYIDSTCLGTLAANLTRDDVNEAYRIIGEHGFSGTFSTTLTGTQTVTVKAVDLLTGEEYTIGSKDVKIPVYSTNYNAIGNVEAITAADGSITIAGWAYDPDDASQSISVKAYIGSTCLGTVDTNFTRTDVNNKYSITGKHGYSGSLSTTYSGKQTVTIKAVDLENGAEYTIGSKTVNIPVPIGCLDSLKVSVGKITLGGWTFDQDHSSESIDVKVYIGSTCVGTLNANQTRNDVNKAYSITGKHGFYGTFNTTITGTQTVTVKAVDVVSGVEYTIGTKSVKIPAYTTNYDAIGNVEAITTTTGTVKIAGWAYDPDDASQSISIKAYIGSTCIGTVDTNFTRDDVNNKFSITGKHGYSGSISTTYSGKQTVTIKAVDLENGAEYTIGSKTVNIPIAVGCIDSLTASVGKITLGGWAFDQVDSSGSIDVKVYIGSTCLGTLNANQTRDDVNKAYSITGKHGFNGTLATTFTGTQTVTVKAVNKVSGVEYTVGSKSVKIPAYTTNYDAKGNVEAITTAAGSISIAGWAYDPDGASQSISIKAYIGSTCLGTVVTDLTRDDVNKAFSITGKHGYSGSVNNTYSGTQTVTVKAVDVENGVEYTIGSKSVYIPASNLAIAYKNSTNITGCVDSITATKGTLNVAGWAYDLDAISDSVSIKVYANSTLLTTVSANLTRDDVNKVMGVTGSHGFVATIPVDLSGDYIIKVVAVDKNKNIEVELSSKLVTFGANLKDIPGYLQAAYNELGTVGGTKYNLYCDIPASSAWCAAFVSWCAGQYGLLGSKVPKFVWCDNAVNWYKQRGLFTQTPKTGYLIFFDWNHDGCHDHVGIVDYVDDKYVYTIEGNRGSMTSSPTVNVAGKGKYAIDYSCITGYGIIE